MKIIVRGDRRFLPRFCWPIGVVLIMLAAGACSSKEDSPEAQIRALIGRGTEAAERKESGTLRGLISDRYSDNQGQDKKTVEGIIRYYFLRNESIYFFTRIQKISFPAPGTAQATVVVAMAGQPISGPEQVERLRADLQRFDLNLVREDGGWKVIRAEWRRADFGEMLN